MHLASVSGSDDTMDRWTGSVYCMWSIDIPAQMVLMLKRHQSEHMVWSSPPNIFFFPLPAPAAESAERQTGGSRKEGIGAFFSTVSHV